MGLGRCMCVGASVSAFVMASRGWVRGEVDVVVCMGFLAVYWFGCAIGKDIRMTEMRARRLGRRP